MNRVDFTKAGGFPFTQETFNFMQSDYILALNGLATAMATLQGAPYVILSGCTTTGSTVSPGLCSVDGELVYCTGGTGSYVRIVETAQNAAFLNGNINPVYITRILAFQSGTGQIPWSSFVRIGLAIQSATVGGVGVTKAGTQLQLPAYPTSLPANGGNADTVGGKYPDNFAASQHTHLFGDLTDLLETGEWTPSGNNWVVNGNNIGKYNRIGNMVFISGTVRFNVNPYSENNTLDIKGLPYIPTYNAGDWRINCTTSYNPDSLNILSSFVPGGEAVIRLFYHAVNVTNIVSMDINGFYITDL